MKNAAKFIISFLLCLVICFGVSISFSPATEARTTTIAEDQEALRELEAQLAKIKKARSEAQSQASQTGEKYTSTEEQMAAIQSEIDALVSERNTTDAIIEGYENYIARLKEEINEQTLKVNEMYDIYDDTVVYYYKYGVPTDMELLMTSDSIADYLTKKDYIGYILEYMNEQAKEIEAISLDLENTYAEITKSYESLDAYREGITETLTEAQKKYEELEAVLETLINDKSLKEAEIGDYIASQLALQKKIDALNKVIAEKYQYIDTDFGWPIDSVYWGSCYISSGYGYRKDPFTGVKTFHSGIDIAAPYGTPVQACKAGTVVTSLDSSTSYGYYIKIKHYDGTYTIYAHLSKRLVNEGATVAQGQIIGKVGSTGRSTGNHLHLTVLVGSEYASPAKYLDKYFKNALDVYGYLD